LALREWLRSPGDIEVSFTAAIGAVVIVYTWLVVPWLGIQRWLGAAVVLLVLLLVGMRNVTGKGSWGWDRRSLWPALCWSVLATLPVLVLVWGIGSVLESTRWTGFLSKAPFLFVWAFGQQLALQTVVFEEARALYGTSRGIGVAALFFALLHLPNPFLTLVTFAAALFWSWVYSRHPNVLPLALSHAAGSLVVISSLDRGITGGMRVGWAFFL
jgi:membrane protease YdiL (CAAX protease family)